MNHASRHAWENAAGGASLFRDVVFHLAGNARKWAPVCFPQPLFPVDSGRTIMPTIPALLGASRATCVLSVPGCGKGSPCGCHEDSRASGEGFPGWMVVLLTGREIGFRSLAEPFLDLARAPGKLTFDTSPSLGAPERSRLPERTKAGLAAAKIRERPGGRPRTMTPRPEASRQLQGQRNTLKETAQILASASRHRFGFLPGMTARSRNRNRTACL